MVTLLHKEVETFKTSDFGPIPSDWEVLEAFDFSPYITSGSRGWAQHYSDSGAPFIRITNLSHDDIQPDLSDLRYVNVSSNDPEAVRTRLEIGDVLISITADIGAIGYVGARIPSPAYMNQHIACLRLPSDKIDSRFVAYFLSSSASQRRFAAMVDVGAKTGLNLTTIGTLKLLVPPLKEQHVIAEALSDADALIESLESLIAKKRTIKQGAMQELLSGRRRLPQFENSPIVDTDIGKLPASWAVQRISAFAQIKTGPFGSALHERDYVDSGTPIITVEHLAEYGITTQNLPMVSDADRRRLVAYSLKEGDIVFSRVGSIDRNARISAHETGWLFSGRLLRVRVPDSAICTRYLSHHFHSEPFKARVRAIAVGQTMASLNTQLLGNVLVALPSLEEQYAIAQILDDLNAAIRQSQEHLAKARQIKQGMMQELLTGRIRLV
jgi:type I restriction enzyme S subunit